ncbi:NAD(P)-dependent alcohol dehydrogenase [Alkalihalobacillus pseudalcaliphilus]|uniref:NAD(P)-dependent alcohol dehydrogenase n=1 Tax=Alkalihalobacillus pseudalcaliphilus TaxID=79884 RepID=UPI00064DB883|nr:NAD(P)-dependent alcohol dehydrogenase [Alkalihalobacillus pseudalcaliphilus]KMK78205.1 aryl-alcohol dehydrogenase [Alkalihalobacillus pseudalcaliphilus]
MKIKAAVINSVNEPYVMEELNISEPNDNELLVKMVASGMCHSDVAVRKGFNEFPLPIILGHEGSAIVEKVGSNVQGFEIGDHVVVSFGYCGQCDNCRTGIPGSCYDWSEINMSATREDGSAYFTREDGTPVTRFFGQSSFSTHSIVGSSSLTKIDKSLDLRLFGPLGCGFMTGSGAVLNGIKPEPGSTIAVFGTGAVGMAAMMAAKVAGCSKVIAVDIHESRLDLAKQLGATHVINSKNENAQEQILALTSGRGVNYSVDTTGVGQVVRTAIEVLAVGGSIAPVAVGKDITISTINDLAMKNRNIVGVLMGRAIPQLSIRQMVDFYEAGNFSFDKLVEYYSIDDINQAEADSLSGKTIKPILIMDESYQPEVAKS